MAQPQTFVIVVLNKHGGSQQQPLIRRLDWQRRIQEMQGSEPLRPLWDTVRLNNWSR
jgi:hypothetical protein